MILVVSNMYPSRKFPNYGVFVKNFVQELSQTEEVKVVALKKKQSKFLKGLGYLIFYLRVFFNYVSGKYSLVYVHYAGYNVPPILLGKFFNRKVPVIVNVHGSDVTPEKRLEEKTNFLTKKIVKKADLTVVPSTYFKEVVENKYGKVPIFVSPSSGVNRNLFKKQEVEKSADHFYIGYVSRIDAEKGWDILLKAFKKVKAEIPNAKLVMVGGGAQDADAVQLINDLGIKQDVEKIQMLSQAELVKIYNKLNVFVFPSTRAGESLGLVGLEAMACGTPVIGSNFGGIKTYTRDGYNGLLFKPGSQADLENKIKKFYALDAAQQKAMGENAMATAQKYDSNLVNKKLIAEIKKFDGN